MDKIHNLIKIRLWGSLKDQVLIVYILLAFVPMSLQSMWTNKRQKRFGELPQVTQATSLLVISPMLRLLGNAASEIHLCF